MLHSTISNEWLGCCTIAYNGSIRVLLERSYETEQGEQISDLGQDLEGAASTQKVKGLGEIDEGDRKGLPLLPALFLELTHRDTVSTADVSALTSYWVGFFIIIIMMIIAILVLIFIKNINMDIIINNIIIYYSL